MNIRPNCPFVSDCGKKIMFKFSAIRTISVLGLVKKGKDG
jgi:hypothetical protein